MAIGRQQPPAPNAAYGPSKCMLNWFGVRINAEEEWLTSFTMNPGWVRTDMGNRAAQIWGMGQEAPGEPEESVAGMFKVLTTATKKKFGGKLVSFAGEIDEW